MRTTQIFFTILILLALGAGLFYFTSYQPKQYAMAVLEFYESSNDDYRLLFQASLKEAYDYDGGLKLLEQKTHALANLKKEISDLNPPLFGKSKRLQPEFEGLISDFSLILGDAEKTMTFLKKAAEFQSLLQPGKNAFPDPNHPTMGDLAKYMDQKIPEIKDKGTDLFEGPAPKLTDAQEFEKLQNSWLTAEPMLDTLRSMAHRLNPTTSLNSFPTSLLTQQELLANEKIENFQRLLREILRSNSANDILNYSFLTVPGMVPPQIAERSERIGKAIAELHEKYAQ